MAMLYRVSAGQAKDHHYGLKTARLMPFPESVLETAQQVSEEIATIRQRRKQASSFAHAHRRRRLILEFHEHLKQTHDGRLEGQTLRNWLNDLRDEFITRMAAVDSLAEAEH